MKPIPASPSPRHGPAPGDFVHLTRRYMFSASHRLHNPVLSEAENLQIYGKCNNRGGHGHNYFLEVTVAGWTNAVTGMVVNLAELDPYVRDRILSCFDQSHLNDQAPFRASVPTTENLCIAIYRILENGWEGLPSARRARLEQVRLEETSFNFFEYRGDTPESNQVGS